jgi:protein-tyrosine phosphatase
MKISLPSAPASAAAAFDYTRPRALHVSSSPTALSAFDEPVRQVVEDMREQRMSLCQSLRQYVFVHQAIVEGALRLVDAHAAQMDGMAKAAVVDEKAPSALSVASPMSPNKAKRRRSPTESHGIEAGMNIGEGAIKKRPSVKRVGSPNL